MEKNEIKKIEIKSNQQNLLNIISNGIDSSKNINANIEKLNIKPPLIVESEKITPTLKLDQITPLSNLDKMTPSPEFDRIYPLQESEQITQLPDSDHITPIPKLDQITPSPESDQINQLPDSDQKTPSPDIDIITPSPESDQITPSSELDQINQLPDSVQIIPYPDSDQISPYPDSDQITPSPKNISKNFEIFEKLIKNEEENFITINPDETKEFIYETVLKKKMKKEMKESSKKLEDIKTKIEKENSKNSNYLSYSNILLPNNSVEFTVTSINECFKKYYQNENIIFTEELPENFQTHYMKKLFINDLEDKEKDRFILKFEYNKNSNFKFENLKDNEKLKFQFIEKIKGYFHQKYNNQYTFELLSIKKGSTELYINSNIPQKIFDEFINHINENEEIKSINEKLNKEILDDKDIILKQIKKKGIKKIIFSKDMLDARGNFDFTNYGEKQVRGQLDYFQPKGWMRTGLNVMDKYDDKNNDWFAMDGNPNEWAVGFHGFKYEKKALLPMIGNLISQPEWGHWRKNDNNTNIYTKSDHPKCGIGVYFGDKIEVCEEGGFTPPFEIGIGKIKVKLAFQCRLNPKEIRITPYRISKAYIVPNTEMFDYSNIRPYGILLKIE